MSQVEPNIVQMRVGLLAAYLGRSPLSLASAFCWSSDANESVGSIRISTTRAMLVWLVVRVQPLSQTCQFQVQVQRMGLGVLITRMKSGSCNKLYRIYAWRRGV